LAPPSPRAGVSIRTMNVRARLSANAFLWPFVTLYSVFVLAPIVLSIALSLTRWNGIAAPEFVGVENYGRALASTGFFKPFINLLVYVALTVPIGILVALGLALLVDRFTGIWSSVFRSALFFPFIVPFFLTAAIWRWMYTPEVGFIDQLLGGLRIETTGWLTTSALMIPALVIVDVWHSAGFNMILLLAGLKAVPREMLEAARADGAGTVAEIRYIVLPQIFPVLFIVIVNGLISALQIFDLPWLLTQSTFRGSVGGPQGGLLFPVMQMASQGLGSLQFGPASVIAVVLLTLIAMLTAALFGVRRMAGRAD
jgi:multiple sugar transport system permease protein